LRPVASTLTDQPTSSLVDRRERTERSQLRCTHIEGEDRESSRRLNVAAGDGRVRGEVRGRGDDPLEADRRPRVGNLVLARHSPKDDGVGVSEEGEEEEGVSFIERRRERREETDSRISRSDSPRELESASESISPSFT